MSDLPAGWARSDIADLVGPSGVFSDGDWVESKDQDPDGDVRLTQLADVGDGAWRDRSNRYMTSSKAAELGCTYLELGDVLVARMPEPLGRACRFPGGPTPCVTVVDVAILRPGSESVDTSWLMHALNSPHLRAKVSTLQAGTTRKRISRKNLAQIQLLVPPRAEQTRIVDELELRLSHVDAAESGLLAAQRRLAAAREALLWSLVVPAGAAAGTELPGLPGGWRWSRLGDVGKVVGGVTKDKKRQSDPDFAEVPYLRVANVQRGYLKLDEVLTIRVTKDKAVALRLEPGDILFNEGGDRDKLGRGWVWEGQVDDCIHQNHVFRARLTEERLEPKFVSWFGNTFGRRWFEAAGKQTTNLASLNLTNLKAFPVPVPPPGVASALVAEGERRMSLLDAAEKSIDVSLAKAAQLRRSLLAAAFSGRLVPQDPDDEPASVLLDRIRAERAAAVPAKTTRRKKKDVPA